MKIFVKLSAKVKFESIKYMIDIKENGSINIHKIIDMLLELSLPSEIYVSKSKQLAFNEQSAADDDYILLV